MEFKYIEIEKTGQICILKLNRPDVLNALNIAMIEEIGLALEEIQKDPGIRGLILTGNGRAFAAGADLSSKAEKEKGSLTDRIVSNVAHAQAIYAKIENFEMPVIAAVNGYALGGGCELTMCCDIRIASEKAVFGMPEVGLGVIACYGGTQRLSMLIGIAKAKELLFTARKIDANEALQIGLVNKVVPESELMKETLLMMETITANAPIALKYTKKCANAWVADRNSRGIEMESSLIAVCTTTEDCVEGGRAFYEKRKPEFKNK